MSSERYPRGLRGQVSLPDGRTVTYETYGAVSGPVVLLLDGSGARLNARVAGAVAHDLGVHVVSINRPGFHGSTDRPDRTLYSTATDLVAAMDQLGIDHASALALSAGTPFAIALAIAAPERIDRLGLIAPVAPPGDRWSRWQMAPSSRLAFYLGRHRPEVLAWMYRRMATTADRDLERAARMLLGTRPEADQAVMMRADVWPLLLESIPDVVSAPDAAALEMSLIARAWDVDPGVVAIPATLWSGEEDDVHPPAMAEDLASRMRTATLRIDPGATFDYLDRYEEVLLDVTGKLS